MRKAQLHAIWIYYKGISPFTLMVSLGLLYTYYQFKDGTAMFVFSKIITLVLTAILLKFYYKTDAFLFYENLGIRQNQLILFTLILDWVVFLTGLYLTALI
jgi:hypothetical protein